MADWVKKLDTFLKFNEQNILTHAGKVSHELAVEHAGKEFEKYDAERRRLEAEQPTSDFDKAIEQVKQLEKKAPGGKTGKKKPCTKKPKPAKKKPARKKKKRK